MTFLDFDNPIALIVPTIVEIIVATTYDVNLLVRIPFQFLFRGRPVMPRSRLPLRVDEFQKQVTDPFVLVLE